MYKGFAEVDTIPNTHKRLREEGYHVSVCMLRGLVRSGALKAAYSASDAAVRKQWGSVHRLRTLPCYEEGSIWQPLSEKKENVA